MPSINGRVVSQSGDPLAEVRVRMHRSVSPGLPPSMETLDGACFEMVAEVLTDTDGGFTLRADEYGLYGITASAPDGRRVRCDWVAPGSRLKLILDEPRPRDIVVLVVSEGEPVMPARGAAVIAPFPCRFGVALAPRCITLPTYPGEVLHCTDDGSLRITWPCRQVGILWGGAWFDVRLADDNSGDPRVYLRPREVAGRVRNPRGEGIEGARVYWGGGRILHRNADMQVSMTDAEGSFSLVAAPVACYMVIEADGYAPTALDVPPGTEDLRVNDVTLDQGVVRQVSVARELTADASGDAVVLHAAPREFVVRREVSPEGRLVWRNPSPQDRLGVAYIKAGKGWMRAGVGGDAGMRDAPSVVRDGESSIRGVVSGEAGAVVAETWVVCQPAGAVPFFDVEHSETRAVRAGPGGRFEIDGLGSGAWLLYAFSDIGVSDLEIWEYDGESGKELQLTIEVLARISGSVLDAGGSAAANVVVYAREFPRAGVRRWGYGFASVTDSLGQYRLPDSGLDLNLYAVDVNSGLWSRPRSWLNDGNRELPVLRITAPAFR